MKKIILFLIITIISATSGKAQEKVIEKTVLTYIENFFQNNFKKMNDVLHPRLSKRGLNLTGKINEDLPPTKLKELMQKKKALPLSKQQNKVVDIRIFNNTAQATLITGYPRMKWKEYITLVKMNGKWQLIDVFWEYYPRQKVKNTQKKKRKQ